MNVKKATNSKLSTTESKKTNKNKQIKNKKKLSKQPEPEQNHKCGVHLEGFQLGRRRGRMVEKIQGLRSIICRYKIDG